MNAIIYARFSPRPDGATSESIEMQVSKARCYIELRGWTLDRIYEDRELSGARADNRPGLQASLKRVTETKGALIVYSLTRLARNTRDALDIAEQIRQADAQLVSVTEQIDTSSPMGRFFYGLMASIGQLEREQISQRTSDAMQVKMAKGKAMFRADRAPYGYYVADGRIELDLVEQKRLTILRETHVMGNSYKATAEQMNAMKIDYRGGRPWSPMAVMRALKVR